MRRHRGWTVAAAIVATVGVGCTDEAASPSGAPEDVVAPHLVAVDPGAAQPPGSEVRGSLVVQEGSHLVATAFPRVDSAMDEDGWQAFFTVDGDPVEVWDRYREALDGPDAASAANSCTVTRVEPGVRVPDEPIGAIPRLQVLRVLTQEPIDGENRLECRANFGRTELLMRYGTGHKLAHRRCHLGEEPVRTCSSVAAHLRVSSWESGPAVEAVPSVIDVPGQRALVDHLAAGNPPPSEPMASVPIPVGPVQAPTFRLDSSLSRLPQPGDAFDDHLDHSLHRGVDGEFPPNSVPPGGRSLMAPVIFDGGACEPGTTAILSVPGDPEDALLPFLDTEMIDDSRRLAEGTDDHGRRWILHGLSTASGYYLDLVFVDTGHDRSIVLAHNCTD